MTSKQKNSPCRAKEWIALIAHSIQGLHLSFFTLLAELCSVKMPKVAYDFATKTRRLEGFCIIITLCPFGFAQGMLCVFVALKEHVC